MFYFLFVLFPALYIHAGLLPEEIEYSGEIPTCRDGGKPLLAAGIGVYTCDQECPAGFRCESEATNSSGEKGITYSFRICCPNLNDLEKIYENRSDRLMNKLKQLLV
ncbi:unnamed protein product [Thelazia callipaeda]|uniref:Single domain-containing protein n=1 Tax=Thelazia callipaeda TaxID=103827 RepID=A0A0N5D652_THECL|nr:unnamed protein product [Thelazia callipaeda]